MPKSEILHTFAASRSTCTTMSAFTIRETLNDTRVCTGRLFPHEMQPKWPHHYAQSIKNKEVGDGKGALYRV